MLLEQHECSPHNLSFRYALSESLAAIFRPISLENGTQKADRSLDGFCLAFCILGDKSLGFSA